MINRNITGIIFLALSICFFVLGVCLPLLSTKQQILGIVLEYKEIALFDSIVMFVDTKEYLLAGIIFIFTFLFPVLKYIDLIAGLLFKTAHKFLAHLDKWNMLDVFLVALLLLNFKMDSKIVVMQIKAGTIFIALSVVFRILTVLNIKKQV